MVPVALLCPPEGPCQGAVWFRVRTTRPSGDGTLLERKLSAPQEAGTWTMLRLDLGAAIEGGGIELEFIVDEHRGDEHTTESSARPLAVWGEPLLQQPATIPKDNVLLISIDTLRADHLGCYGYERATSPVIDALAGEGVRFAQAIAQSPWTTPSHMSLLTSLYPSTHGCNQGLSYFDGFRSGVGRYRRLADERLTLAEILQRHGYRTLALVGGGTVTANLGFAQGFDVYREESFKLIPSLMPILNSWLSSNREQPFFLFFHTFEVHSPYTNLDFVEPLLSKSQTEGLRTLFADTRRPGFNFTQLRTDLRSYLEASGLFRREITSALYDGGIHRTDAFLGELFSKLQRLGLSDRTLIVVTSDHGEEFADHDPERIYDAHCSTLYDELLRVPLLLRLPGKVPHGRVVEHQVELVDVAPTILDLLGIPPPKEMQGRSLLKLIRDDGKWHPQGAVSEAICSGPEWKSLRTEEYKYIVVGEAPEGKRSGVPRSVLREELFDLRVDPREQDNLSGGIPPRTQRMREQLYERLSWLARQAIQAPSARLDAQVIERLRALGYVD